MKDPAVSVSSVRAKCITLLLPTFFVLFSSWIIVTANTMDYEERAFPLLIGTFQLAVSLCQFFVDIRGKVSDSFTNSNVSKVIEAGIVMFLYVAVLRKIGYLLDTVLLAFYISVTLGHKKWHITLLSAVVITLATFFIFKICLRVPLPMIFFEF